MTPRRKILFLCTGNSCRSQMAEAILRLIGGDRFEALSAGSHPAGFIHVLAAEAMQRLDIPMEDQDSKSWDEYHQTRFDAVITLCDEAAKETCPAWPEAPLAIHWSLPDPAQHPGDDEERIQYAVRVAQRLTTKLKQLIALDWSKPKAELEKSLTFLGEI